MNILDLKRLRDFLALKTGIFIDDGKLEKIYKKKLEEFIAAHGFEDFTSFYTTLLKDRILLQEIINEITVNETYFFREEYQFKTLVEHILPELDAIRPPNESINILSAPTSSGEELYSIAIYILEYAKSIFNKRDFYLIGIDIDSEMIEKAKKGEFSRRSVSKLPASILAKYFKQIDPFSYKIDAKLTNGLHFKVVNVLDHYAMKRLGSFDVIFSRNMLIYFDEKTRSEIIATFHSMLKPQGYLLLGHAEKIPFGCKLFRRIKIEESIIYQKI